MDEFAIERYRQRYETWRHLDKIRYQTVQLAIGIAGAIALVIRATGAGFPSWLWIVLAVIFGLLWQTLSKVNLAIRKNGDALNRFGKDVGDELLPDVSKKDRSVFFYIETSFGVLAIFFLLLACISLFA